MDKITTAIIGGGAAGLMLAVSLKNGGDTVLFERGERLGRKLSATGNGQGNVSNDFISPARYFCVEKNVERKALEKALARFDCNSIRAFFKELGVLLQSDERGRVYPFSRQASSLTDALRFRVQQNGVTVKLNTTVNAIKKTENGFSITYSSEQGLQTILAENVVLCTGGKAAKNFGTDGSAYALAEGLGHSLTCLYPSLVQLKTQTTDIKTLKGIRVNGAKVRAIVGERELCSIIGDVIFTDYGVSGDAIFRLSSFLTDRKIGECSLSIDFLPDLTEEELLSFLQKKEQTVRVPKEELLCGVLNNQLARALAKRCAGNTQYYAKTAKDFRLPITGSLGFDYAQVTKGGVPLFEVNDVFESRKAKGLYLAGEILDVDGECGGFNLHFAYASARTVAEELNANSSNKKGRETLCK